VTTARITRSCRRGRLTVRVRGTGLERLTVRTRDRLELTDRRSPLAVSLRHAGRQVTVTVADVVGGELTRRRTVPRACRE
jgi:hypothetical protein